MKVSKTTTIFRQLILNIIIPAVLALVALAAINIVNKQTILVDSHNTKNEFITDEIKNVFDFQDVALDVLESRLDKKMEKYSSELIYNLFRDTDSIETADLYSIRNKIGMDTLREDIYVINRNGIVVNTTFDKDLGLNFFSFGEEHKKYLESIFTNSQFVSERFTIESSTRRLRKYSYQSTRNRNYIVEIGVYSQKADEIIDFIKDRINTISKKQNSVIDVDLFINEDNPFSINDASELPQEHKEIIANIFHKQESETYTSQKEGRYINSDYIFVGRQKTDLYKGAVIRIVSDRTDAKNLIQDEMLKSFGIFGIALIIVVALTYRKTKVITDPLKRLVHKVDVISGGKLNERVEVMGNNEITRLSIQFNKMVATLEEYYRDLEKKVKERTAEIQMQKEEISAQRDAIESQRDVLADKNEKLEIAYSEIEEQRRNIMDSIIYAKRIQKAILPGPDFVNEALPNSFVLLKPKDIVSGDFFWIDQINEKTLVAAADCTGHGVPGAFMSLLSYDQLNDAVKIHGREKPAQILDEVNRGLTYLLKQKSGEVNIKDGMDCAICSIDFKTQKIEFAGAYNPVYIIRKTQMDDKNAAYELELIKADKFAVGAYVDEDLKHFTNHEIQLEKGDTIYIFSDGYADQFGGADNRKFMSKRFKKLLIDVQNEPMEKQKEILNQTIENWRGNNEQIDDILVIGIRL